MINKKLPQIWYGGDYNPEQWDHPAIWEEDIRYFKEAGINVATLNVFSWALNQPDEETYDFSRLEMHMNRLYDHGIYTCLATSTAAHPAWMARKYPDVLRVDFQGRQRRFGGRHNSCPNSPTYRHYAGKMAGALGSHFKDHPGLLMWHVSNEYGGYCYCDNCAAGFRKWLKQSYHSIDRLNKLWNTRFWGHTFYSWEEIVVPNALSEEGEGNVSVFQGISLDYRRFQSDSLLECYQLEHTVLKTFTPDLQITTNLMGTYSELDYFKWGKAMDVVSWDSYPALDTPVSLTAMTHDLMRGLKDGKPFMLMEQTPSQQNWQSYNALKRPGVMRLWSYQALAHGADTVLFFQLRRSIGACEKFHGAVIEHAGHNETRVFRETEQVGRELQQLEDKLIGARITSRVAIVYDWENRWALDLSSGPTVSLDYVKEVHSYYRAFYRLNIPVDFISVEADLTGYDLVVAPVLYMVKTGHAKRIERFVENGGTFVSTFFSGIVNEHDLVTLGGYPGELRSLFGIWVEETDALDPAQFNHIVMSKQWGKLSGHYQCNLLFDLIHSEGAEVLATYGSDFYAGSPVVTRNTFGKGSAIYVGSSGDQAFTDGLIETVCNERGIVSLLPTPDGVEVTERTKAGESFLFVLNHRSEQVALTLIDQYNNLLTNEELAGEVTLEPHGVLLLKACL